MIVRRSLKRPGAVQFESSGYEVEITPQDFGLPPATTVAEGQRNMHILFREARIAILFQAVLDGVMSNEEYTQRLQVVNTPLPSWIQDVERK
jgi:hypothetical protein